MSAQAPSGAAVELSKQVDELFSKYDNKNSPGCAIAIIRSGHIIHQRGYGMANLDFGIPNSSTTVFNVASMSKQFTAMSIALLVQQGKYRPTTTYGNTFLKCLITALPSLFVISLITPAASMITPTRLN